jgi:hypothetical protein
MFACIAIQPKLDMDLYIQEHLSDYWLDVGANVLMEGGIPRSVDRTVDIDSINFCANRNSILYWMGRLAH